MEWLRDVEMDKGKMGGGGEGKGRAGLGVRFWFLRGEEQSVYSSDSA